MRCPTAVGRRGHGRPDGFECESQRPVGSTGMGIGTYTATAGASGRGQITAAPNTIDGVTLAVGNRILVGSGENRASGR